MSFQNITVLGNLGKDPELSHTTTGKAVCKFSVACTEKIGKDTSHTEWFNVVVWEKQAEAAAKYLTKGDKILVMGRLQTREWQNDQGDKKRATDLVAQTVRYVTTKNQGQEAPAVKPSPPRPTERTVTTASWDGPVEDIPF